MRLDLIRRITAHAKYEHEVVLASGVTIPLGRDRKRTVEALLGARTP